MKQIFISYARKYEEFARKLATSFSNIGVKVWLDVKDIPAGMNWNGAIQSGLDAADIMIVIITPEALESRNVANEWQYFISEGKPVIPVVLISTKIHYQLRQLQYIDFQDQDYALAFQELCAEMQLIDEQVVIELPPVATSPHRSTPPVSAADIDLPYRIPRMLAVGLLVLLTALLVALVVIVMLISGISSGSLLVSI